MCDPYDSTFVIVCNNSIPTYTQQCATGNTCVGGICQADVIPPTEAELCDGQDGNLVPITPQCTTYTLCGTDSNNASVTMMPPLSCDNGEYFDYGARSCVVIPPQACTTPCTDGSCPDPTDCTQYHACVGGSSVAIFDCPSAAPEYDPGTKTCVSASVPSLCYITTKCDFTKSLAASTTTPTTKPAQCTGANLNQNYPYHGDCKK